MSDLFNTGVRPIIDQWLLDKSKESRDYGNYWSASQAGYCMRKVIFERLGVPHVSKDDDARKQRVFTAGKIFHDWIQGITKDSGLSIAQELELQDEELMIRGHIDDLVLVGETIEYPVYERKEGDRIDKPTQVATDSAQINKHLILYDYKTRNSRNFDFSKTLSYFHKMQLGTYMYMLRKMGEIEHVTHRDTEPESKEFVHTFATTYGKLSVADLPESRILNIEKDTLRMSEVQLLWSDGLEKEVVGYWELLNKYWADKKIPPCTCADHENGFMALEKWNPYFYEGKPCSIAWYKLKKEEGVLV